MRIFDIIFQFLTDNSSTYFWYYHINPFFDSGSPIFSQKRIGKNENIFKVYKFRTMVPGTVNCEHI